MNKRWVSFLLCIALTFGAALPAAAEAAPAARTMIVDNGGFARTVRSFLAEMQLAQNREFRLFLYDAEIPPDASVATGQFLSLASSGVQMPDSIQIAVLGDVLGTGQAGIGQVTRIARALTGAEPLDGIWLLAGDLDGSGRIDLSDLVQAAAQLQTVQAVTDDNLQEQILPLYIETPAQQVQIPLYFAGDRTDIPYVAASTVQAILTRAFSSRWGEQPVTLRTGNGTTILTRENGCTMRLDFENRQIVFADYNAFFAADAAMALDVVSAMPKQEDGTAKYIERASGSFSRAGRPVTISLEDYGVEAVQRGSTGYIPLQTFSDIFMTPLGCSLACNGRMVALASLLNPYELIALYYQAPPGARSAELAAFTYNEMCLALDLHYGLRQQQNITSFDALLRQTNLYEPLHSEDPVTADRACKTLTDAYLGDVHTRFIAPSIYAGSTAQITSAASSIAIDEYDAYSAIAQAARVHAFPHGVPSYQEIGDTAFVTLDSFAFDSNADYDERAPGPDAPDTVGIISYAHSRITRENSPVRNVVLDLSCNTGGDLNAAVYALGWLTGTVTINLNDTRTGAQACARYRSDVNLDGTYDAADTVQELHCACLISSASFSAANLAATVLKGTSVQLIGQRTGGGSCAVLPLTLADGTVLRISGSLQVSAMENGSYYDTDRGIEPDYRIFNIEDFYDRDGLCRLVSNIYSMNGLASAREGRQP